MNDAKVSKLNKRLKEEGFKIKSNELLEYIKDSSKSRELSKFIFTKCLSDLLEIIALWGKGSGLSREELSHLDIREILDSLNESSGRSIEDNLRSISEKDQKIMRLQKPLNFQT